MIYTFSSIPLVVGVFAGWRLLSEHYHFPCSAWLGWMVERDNPFAKELRAAAIVDHLQLSPEMEVLDAGCGPGRVTLPLAEALGPKGKVTALDVQMEMLNQVRRKVEKKKLENVHYIQASLGKGTISEKRYDRAVLVSVLGEIPNQVSALKELYQAMAPGDILSISETIFDPHFQSRKKVTQLASQIGFNEKGFFGKRYAYTIHLEKPL